MKIINYVFLFIISGMLISFGISYAEESQTIQVEIKYTNGDRVDFNGMKLVVYQDFDKAIFLEKQLESSIEVLTVPANHRYKIEVYANGMYADVAYVQINNTPKEITMNIPLSGGLKFEVFYNDGQSAIEGVRVVIKSKDGTEWRQGNTNALGETIRYWVQSTTNQDDYYIADVFLGDLFLKSHYPIKLIPGLSKNEKIIIDIPKIIEDRIIINLYKDGTTKISNIDETHTITLTNKLDEQSVTANVNFRGEAYFSNLKPGVYLTKIMPNEAGNWPELELEIIGNHNKFNIFKTQSVKLEESSNILLQEIESCNCVAFRFDDVQDYWLNDVQIQTMDVFQKQDLPLTLGIIADSFGNDLKLLEFVKQGIGNNFKIANHGVGNIAFTEFSFEEQDSRIKDSSQRIKNTLNVDSKIFIPPQNRFNEDTKQSLLDNGFTYISSSLLHGDPPPFPLTGEKLYQFPEISTTGTFDPVQNVFLGESHELTLVKTLEGLEKYGFAVITMHPQEFSTIVNGTYQNQLNTNQIFELKTLVEKLQNEKIKIVYLDQINLDSQTERIPIWLKNNAEWWANDQIDDDTFVQGIEYLIQQNIIKIPEQFIEKSSQQIIPVWIKNNAEWWANDQIDDDTFVQGIEYLIKNGIITY